MPDALLCAVCLDEEKRLIEDVREAVTIANGQAVCPLHFATIRDLVSTSAGAVSLWGIRQSDRFRASR
jgi:hypothetical protein